MLENKWHLAQDTEDAKVTDFELQLWRLYNGFIRWQEQCEQVLNATNLTGNDLSVLHIIRMKNKAKTAYEISWLLNRDDSFGIAYSIKKLLKMNFIAKTKSSDGKRNIRYEITENGIKNTDLYTKIRKQILVSIFNKEDNVNLEEITKALALVKSMYDEATHTMLAFNKCSMV